MASCALEEPIKVCATRAEKPDESAPALDAELAALGTLTIPALQQRYLALFGRPAGTTHRAFLLRRVAWELQAHHIRGLNAEATDRLAELADAINPLAAAVIAARRRGESKPPDASTRPRHQSIRRPMPGTMIQRVYRGRQILVRVRNDDFEYDGRPYRSLSAIAKAVTGAHWNGWLFFGFIRQSHAV